MAERIRCELLNGPIDEAAVQRFLADASCGAELIFRGVVRDHNEGRAVEAVTYEAFVPLALRTLESLASEGIASAPAARVAISHRLGCVRVGELSTLIAVAAPHREEAYRVSRFLIEELKKRADIQAGTIP